MTIYHPYWFALSLVTALHLLIFWGLVFTRLSGGSIPLLLLLCSLFIASFGYSLSKLHLRGVHDDKIVAAALGLDASRTPRGNDYTPRA